MKVNFSFWQKWLYLTAIALIALGVIITFLNQTVAFDFFNSNINIVFFQNANTQLSNDFQQWIYALLGATLIGWGITNIFVIRHAFKNKEKWAWQALLLSTTAWFILDTAASLHFKATFNAAFNTIIYALIVIPLIYTRKEFYLKD